MYIITLLNGTCNNSYIYLFIVKESNKNNNSINFVRVYILYGGFNEIAY